MREPTFKEAMRAAHNQTAEKLAPFKKVLIKMLKEKFDAERKRETFSKK